MYLMLGTIALEPIDVTDFSEIQAARFAEHQVLKGKPRLQAMGESLAELNLSVRLHHKIGGVERRYQALLAAKAKQDALALIWGRGKFKGNFVITDIHSNTLFTDKYGNVLCRELTINLKEYVGELKNNLLGAALNIGKGSLLGSILPPEFFAGMNAAKEALTKGIDLYNQGKRIVDEVQNTIAIMKQFSQDPATALAYLPSVLGNLDGALGSFSELTGMSELFNGVRSVLPVVSEFSQEVAEIQSGLMAVQSDFQQGSSGSDWSEWFPSANRTMSEVAESFDFLAPRVAEMTAWIVLRNDDEVNNDTDRA